MKTFVLVHGAWHGGWCWRHVADRLRAAGHAVFTPTCTGLGERAHLLDARVGLGTFVQDICAVIETEELEEVVLVGHSFGGLVISGVADRLRGRLASLIYLDALLVRPGESALDLMPPAVRAERSRTIDDDGLRICLPSAEKMGVVDPAQAAWVERRITPHPLKAYRDPLPLAHPLGNGLPKAYVAVTAPWYAPLAEVRARVQAEREADPASWGWHELAAGHDAMVTHPEPLAELLLRLA